MATTRTSTPLPRAAPGRAIGIWLLAGAATAGAVGVFAATRHLAAPLEGLHLPWWALLGGFYVAECAVVHVHFRRETHTLSPIEVPLVLGLFAASPLGLISAQLLGMGAALVFYRRQRPLKAVFKLSQSALGTVLAVAVFRSIVSGQDPFGPAG